MQQSGLTSYRPDIDGMRAIAVLGVVLFHIEHSLIPGGYAGVDIFFVISGYLITLLIYKQMGEGTFSFADFYQRRINRIAPALFVVIACVGGLGLLLLSPSDLVRLSKSALYASFGVSNVFFWREYGSYFSSGIDEAPLLHTWSLGVEEQFYFIWPLILLFVVRLKPAVRYVAIGLGVIATIAVSEFGVRNAASASYYLLPTRVFELLLGGATAVFVFHRGTSLRPGISNTLGICGLALTICSFYQLNELSVFPGLNALYPCLGAVLLIASGVNSRSLVARLLAMKPLVFVGLISYSLYLWHWPLIAFAHYRGIAIDGASGTVIFALSVALAWVSWKFVETPFRRSGASLGFRAVAARRYVAPVAVLVVAVLGVTQNQGLPSRFDPLVSRYEQIISTAANELRPNCHSSTFYYDRKPVASCVLGTSGASPEILLVGDSFANHFTGMIDVLAKNDKVAVTDYTMDGCPPVKGMGFGSQASYAEKCRLRNDFIYKYISSSSYKYVVLASNWTTAGLADTHEAMQARMNESIKTILAAGARPVIIIDNENTGNANCPIRRLLSGSTESCDKKQDAHQVRNEMFAKLKQAFPEIAFIDPNAAMCSDGICRSMLGQVPLYRDNVHLNDVGSRLIGKMLAEKDVHLVPPHHIALQSQ